MANAVPSGVHGMRVVKNAVASDPSDSTHAANEVEGQTSRRKPELRVFGLQYLFGTETLKQSGNSRETQVKYRQAAWIKAWRHISVNTEFT
jgi:hypothetical protein